MLVGTTEMPSFTYFSAAEYNSLSISSNAFNDLGFYDMLGKGIRHFVFFKEDLTWTVHFSVDPYGDWKESSSSLCHRPLPFGSVDQPRRIRYAY